MYELVDLNSLYLMIANQLAGNRQIPRDWIDEKLEDIWEFVEDLREEPEFQQRPVIPYT